MSIFRRVLVPLEFASEAKDGAADQDGVFELGEGRWVRLSSETMEAVRLAARLSMQFIELVHATPDLAGAGIYTGADGSWLPRPSMLNMEAAARASSRGILKQIGAALLPNHEVTCHAAAGRPVDVIMGIADKSQPDAIVLAASARRRLSRALIGSTVDRIIRRSSCIVVVVPVVPD